MRENVERCGGTVVMVMDDWGAPVDPSKVEDALKANPGTKVVAFVHAETSTGVRGALLERYNLEIGAGLGDLAGKVWRVGLMGQSATPEHVTLFLAAMEDELSVQGAAINVGAALPAMRVALAGYLLTVWRSFALSNGTSLFWAMTLRSSVT